MNIIKYFSFGFSVGVFMSGCGGGDKNSARVGVEETKLSFFKSLLQKEMSDFSLNNSNDVNSIDGFILKYFGIDLFDQIHYGSVKGYANGLKIFTGPSYADGKTDLIPGLHFRVWHNTAKVSLVTSDYACGEVVGVFEFEKNRILIDVLMSRDTDWKNTRGGKSVLGTGEIKGKCAHSDSGKYVQTDPIGVDNFLYKRIVDDIESVNPDIRTRVGALTIAMINIAMILSNKELPEDSRKIWNEGGFQHEIFMLQNVDRNTYNQFPRFAPRIVLVSVEDIYRTN